MISREDHYRYKRLQNNLISTRNNMTSKMQAGLDCEQEQKSIISIKADMRIIEEKIKPNK